MRLGRRFPPIHDRCDEKIADLQRQLQQAQEELAEHDRLKGELNQILHPRGDGPLAPSWCDLIAYVAGDRRQVQEELGQLLQRLYFKSWIMMGMFQGLKDFKAERDAAIERAEAAEADYSRLLAKWERALACGGDAFKLAVQLEAAEALAEELRAQLLSQETRLDAHTMLND